MSADDSKTADAPRFRRNEFLALALALGVAGCSGGNRPVTSTRKPSRAEAPAKPFLSEPLTAATAREAVELAKGRADDLVRAVAWSRSGDRLAAAGDPGVIYVIDTHAGRVAREIDELNLPVWALAWSPRVDVFASGNQDGTVRLWGADGRGHVLRGGGEEWAFALAFSRDGRRLASSHFDGRIRIWDIAAGRLERSFVAHEREALALAWSRDGRVFATGAVGGALATWDAANPLKPIARRDVPAAIPVDLNGLAWLGDRLASTSQDGPVRFWTQNLKPLGPASTHEGWSRGVSTLADSRLVASSGEDGFVRIWDAGHAREIAKLAGHEGPAWWVDWARDGSRLASAGDDGTVRIWGRAA